MPAKSARAPRADDGPVRTSGAATARAWVACMRVLMVSSGCDDTVDGAAEQAGDELAHLRRRRRWRSTS